MRFFRVLNRRIQNTLTKRGVLGSALFVAEVVAGRFRQRSRSALAAQAARDTAFDAEHGVDTAGFISLSSLDIQDDAWKHGNRYEAVPPVDFGELLRDHDLTYSDTVFLDLGSGKGRAVLPASRLPFRQVIGVELCQELDSIARENVVRFPNHLKRCTDIQLVCSDATKYSLPLDPLVVFLYNPFEAPLMRLLVRNLEATYEQRARRIVVVYFNPTCADLLKASPIFKRTTDHSTYLVFDTRST